MKRKSELVKLRRLGYIDKETKTMLSLIGYTLSMTDAEYPDGKIYNNYWEVSLDFEPISDQVYTPKSYAWVKAYEHYIRNTQKKVDTI